MKASINSDLPQLESIKKVLKDQGIEVDISNAENKYAAMAFKLYRDLSETPQINDKPKSNSKYMRNK